MAGDAPLVSVVFITYKRLDLLTGAVHALYECSAYPNLETIISDDGSPPSVVDGLRQLPVDRIISERNAGLGANTNRGLRAARGEYVLHHQDDFKCQSSEPFIARSIDIMDRHPDVGLVRLHHIDPLFQNREDHVLPDGTPYSILSTDQPPIKGGLYLYSDHPHIKRADFHEKVGFFTEGLGVGETEEDFCRQFLANNRYKLATFWRSDLFENLGIGSSTRQDRYRANLRTWLSGQAWGRTLLRTYGALPTGVRRALRH